MNRMAEQDHYEDLPENAAASPALSPEWFKSRWGPDDQKGNGNLMTPAKTLQAIKLVKSGEVISLGMPYDTRMPIAPGRAYALRMPGGPTGGPYGEKSRTIWNDEFIATEIGQIGTQMDALGHLGSMCGFRGDKTRMLFYNGNRLSDMWSPYGLKKLGMENAPVFMTRGVLFDVQGLKGRVLDVGEPISLADLKACLKRQGIAEDSFTPGDAAFVRTGHGSRWYTETKTFYDGAPGITLECAKWLARLEVVVVGADNFAVEVVPPVDPEVFHPCHQHLIMENGIYLHEGMTFEGLIARNAYEFAYIFAPLKIVGATGSPGNPVAVI
jgi:kynurenine formamidase